MTAPADPPGRAKDVKAGAQGEPAMTGETSAEQAIRTADVLDGRAPWHSGVLVLAAYHLRALVAERNAAIARAEAAEREREQLREALKGTLLGGHTEARNLARAATDRKEAQS